jgi:hypothetical protein
MWEPQPLATLRASTACMGITLPIECVYYEAYLYVIIFKGIKIICSLNNSSSPFRAMAFYSVP